MPALVSVIIPTYNRAHCLSDAIRSALQQTHATVEVLVIDDGSTDSTEAVLRATFAQEPRLRYVRQDNGGVSAARNHGLRLAQGAYVALLDSDDVWLPWKLELQLAAMERHPELVMTWTDMEAVDGSGKIVAPRYLRQMYHAYRWFEKQPLFENAEPLAVIAPTLAAVVGDNKLYSGEIYSAMLMGNLVHTSTALIRHQYLERIGTFDENLRRGGEDYDFHVRTCREGPVGLLDLPAIRYQTGMQDQFVANPRNNLYFARAYLHTLAGALARDGESGRITLPPGMLLAAQAWAQAWLGEEYFHLGQQAEARQHLWESLRLRPGQGRVWMLLGATVAPAWLVRWGRCCYHSLRPSFRGTPAAKSPVPSGPCR